MSSNNDVYNSENSHLSYTSPDDDYSDRIPEGGPYPTFPMPNRVLEFPSPDNDPRHRWKPWEDSHTGYTPDKKKGKKEMVVTPSTKQKIDEIHHYQQQQMNMQRELYYEQKVTARRLSFLEKIAMKFCSSKKDDVAEPSYRTPSPSNHVQSSIAPIWSSVENVPSPNSWERRC